MVNPLSVRDFYERPNLVCFLHHSATRLLVKAGLELALPLAQLPELVPPELVLGVFVELALQANQTQLRDDVVAQQALGVSKWTDYLERQAYYPYSQQLRRSTCLQD